MYINEGGGNYDPAKAHAYYERTKKLKGRQKGSAKPPATTSSSKPRVQAPQSTSSAKAQAVQARIGRLRANISKLHTALSVAEAALSEKRQTAAKADKKNSDGKTTAKERQDSKEYRDKNKETLKSKRKKAASDSKDGGRVSDMSESDIRRRIIKIKGALRDAKRQLSTASQELGQLAHSAIMSEPNINEYFAHFQSAERTPSQ